MQVAWPDAWPHAPGACPCPPGARKGTTGTASWLGRPAGPLGQTRCHDRLSNKILIEKPIFLVQYEEKSS